MKKRKDVFRYRFDLFYLKVNFEDWFAVFFLKEVVLFGLPVSLKVQGSRYIYIYNTSYIYIYIYTNSRMGQFGWKHGRSRGGQVLYILLF